MDSNYQTEDELHTGLRINPDNIELVQEQPKQCRICLSSAQNDADSLVSPCECLGSVRFVHRSCFQKWMQTKLLKNFNTYSTKGEIDCELCKKGIKIDIQLKRQCLQSSTIFQRIKQNPIIFLIFLLGIPITLGVLIYSITNLVRHVQQGFDKTESSIKAVIIVSIPLAIMLMSYFVVQLADFFTAKRAILQLGGSH